MKVLVQKEQLIIFIMIVFLLTFSMESFAGKYEDALSFPSVRSLNMGGAFTAVADDEDILFYNPAGLAFLEYSRLTSLSFQMNFNIDMINSSSKLISTYAKVKPKSGRSKSESISEKSIVKLKKFNPLFSFAGPIQITYIRPSYAISFLNLQTKVRMDFEYEDGRSNIFLHGRSDTLAMIAYGRRVYRELAVGLTLKYLFRGELGEADVFAKVKDVSDQKETVSIKRGLGFDIGLIYPIEKWGVKIGAALKDFANTNLKNEERKLDGFDKVSKSTTAKIKQTFAIGVSYQPEVKIPYGKLAYLPHNLILSADIRSGNSFSDRLCLGMEMKLYRWLALRLGTHAGVQLGLGIRTKTLSFDYMFTPKIKDKFVGKETDNNHYISLMLSY